jgi:REP-associated tyrosine transposase
MASTYTSLHYHVVFSAKNRQPFLIESIRGRLFAYLSGIARKDGMNAFEIGGVADHVHLLLSIPASLAVSKAVQLLKGGSSHWLKETFPNLNDFAWQDGYAAFTVSQSQLDDIRAYVRSQREHHRTKTFAEEYRAFWSGIIFNTMNIICWVNFGRRYATPLLLSLSWR